MKYVVVALTAFMLLSAVVVRGQTAPPPTTYIEIWVLAETPKFDIFPPFPIDLWGYRYPISEYPYPMMHRNVNPTVWEPIAGWSYEIFANPAAFTPDFEWASESSHETVMNAEEWPHRYRVWPTFAWMGE